MLLTYLTLRHKPACLHLQRQAVCLFAQREASSPACYLPRHGSGPAILSIEAGARPPLATWRCAGYCRIAAEAPAQSKQSDHPEPAQFVSTASTL